MVDILRVENIRKSFRSDLLLKRNEVLHGVSFSAQAGEILGFLGPNGAGKTTTIKIVLGLIKPDSGTVYLFDQPIEDHSVKSRIGYLPETLYFYPHLTLVEFLTFCGQMSWMGGNNLKRRVAEVIERVGLGTDRNTRLKNYSKGMLQRAGLAQAVLHDPDLLILDEPFSGLDPLGRVMVRDILLDLKKQNKTIFFSSHILPDMEALCNRACIIREGVVVRSVGLDELMRIGKRKVRIVARGCNAGMTEAVSHYVESVRVTDEEVFLVLKKHEFIRPVVQYLYSMGAEILEVVKQHPTLEEIFLSEIVGESDAGHRKEIEEEITFAGF